MSLFRRGKKQSSKHTLQEQHRRKEERKNLLSVSRDFFMQEAYKSLRTNVNFSLAGDLNRTMVISVTSALQGEGKSFTATNLAISYAQADQKVLLVDCDLRRPKIHTLLQLQNELGLSNVLMDLTLLPSAIVPSGISGLDVLTSGTVPPNPSELLDSSRMDQLLCQVQEQYDCVILDTPPVNMVTDSAVLASKVEGVLFVVRVGVSQRPAVLQAVDQLLYGRGKVLGFVLNGVDLSKPYYGYNRYGYGRYYGRYGGYGYRSAEQERPPSGGSVPPSP